jgi:hypothetical protein
MRRLANLKGSIRKRRHEMSDELIKRLRSQKAVDGRPHEIEQLTDEAAALIEQQAARIAALEAQIATVAPAVDAQPAWISVDERLPEIDYSNPAYARGVKVLAAWGNDPGNVAEMEYRSNAYAKTEKGRLPRFEWQGRVSPWTVTHWMPLPEAPAALSNKDPQ